MPIAFAHRGARSELPENTIPAFQRALALGATGLESDVWCSSDGDAVLVHDPTVRRGLRRVRVARTTADQLAGLDVPRLRDLYEVCGDEFELSLDLKNRDAASLVVRIARERDASARTWLCHPDREFLTELRGVDPDVRLVLSTWKRALPGSFERHIADLAALGIDALNMHHSEWTPGLVALAHRFDLRAFAWDVQEVRHLRAVCSMQIDGVYSDHVDRMVGVLAEWTR
ncbi:MAG: glycerophosphodiester phosphodiesterase [Acidimicrobiia bacterium]